MSAWAARDGRVVVVVAVVAMVVGMVVVAVVVGMVVVAVVWWWWPWCVGGGDVEQCSGWSFGGSVEKRRCGTVDY